MKLHQLFADSGFHSSIITTFAVDFEAYEAIALSRLRASGCRNNILIADNRMIGHALSSETSIPQLSGRYYSVFGVNPTGVFHPKMVLQLGHDKGRLLVGSANATAPGFAGNLELVGLVECGVEVSGEQRLIAAAWEFVLKIVDRNYSAVEQQLGWLESRTPWLSDASPTTGSVSLLDDSEAAFLTSRDSESLMDRFLSLVGTSQIDQLLVMTPYWDQKLEALKELIARARPTRARVLIDKDRALFPSNCLSEDLDVDIFDLGTFASGRFVHAKLIVATIGGTDHVLFGSANCTTAALGKRGSSGTNEEACFYRRLNGGQACESLGLTKLLEERNRVEPSQIPKFEWNDDLPLKQLSARHPGYFECLYGTLSWRAPANVRADTVEIELWDSARRPLAWNNTRLPNRTASEFRFDVNELQSRPAFAVVVHDDGARSTPAVVVLVDEIRNEARDSRSKAADRSAFALGEATEEGLWLLEILDDLEKAEADRQTKFKLARSVRGDKKEGPVESGPDFRTLDYEKFVSGRRSRIGASGISRNSLGDSDSSMVRSFLNRVLAIAPSNGFCDEGDVDPNIIAAFDMSDDVTDADGAIEQGDNFESYQKARRSKKRPTEEKIKKKKAMRRRATQKQIAKAVDALNVRIRERAQSNTLSTVDVLRLRAVLTVVIASGYSKGCTANDRTALQVYQVSESDDDWPRLVGRILFSLFGGRVPAIGRLRISDLYDRIPDDLVETWACCIWAACAGWSATAPHSRQARIASSFSRLLDQIHRLVGMQEEELKDAVILNVLTKLSDRFSERLGLDAGSVMEIHRERAAKIPPDEI